MIDDKTKAFLADIPHIVSDASTIFDLMLTCYLRGRTDQNKVNIELMQESYRRALANAVTGAAQPTAQPNKPRMVIVSDATTKPTTH